MQLKNIAIVGARGNVGTATITALENSSSPPGITVISRSATTHTTPSGKTISTRIVDYTSLESLTRAFNGHDAVLNCLPGHITQYETSKLIIDAAVAAGVGFYFTNEFVTNLASPQYIRLPESAVGAKIRVRKYLEELAAEEKIAWTSLNGGPFFDMWLMKGPGGFDIKNREARIYGTGENPLFWTPLPTIGLAVANMLLNPDKVLNHAVHICPFIAGILTQNILLQTLETVLDTKFTVTHVDIAKINKNARIALERGEVATAMRGLALSNQFYEEDSGNNLEGLTENELVGVKEMSVEEAVRNAIKQYGDDSAIVERMYRVDPCEI